MTKTLKIKADTENDAISKLITKLNTHPNWTSEKQSILKELVKLLENLNFKMLILKEHRYKVGKVGTSCIYEVSDNRRGLFALFRGKSVRVICVASGRFDRTVMVKEIN
jgi:hypothetical protein